MLDLDSCNKLTNVIPSIERFFFASTALSHSSNWFKIGTLSPPLPTTDHQHARRLRVDVQLARAAETVLRDEVKQQPRLLRTGERFEKDSEDQNNLFLM